MEVFLKFTKEELSLLCYALNAAISQTTVTVTAKKMREIERALQPLSEDKC